MLKTISSSSPSLPLLFKFNKSSLPSSSSSFSRCLSFPFSSKPSSPPSPRTLSLFSFKNPMNNLLGKLGFGSRSPETSMISSIAQGPDDDLPAPGQQFAQFGAGCFWGVELAFQRVPGVTRTEVGYTQGYTDNPTYEDICSGMTNHSEVVRVQYDPKECSFETLLDVFWSRHDPTTLNRQGNEENIKEGMQNPFFDSMREGNGGMQNPMMTSYSPPFLFVGACFVFAYIL